LLQGSFKTRRPNWLVGPQWRSSRSSQWNHQSNWSNSNVVELGEAHRKDEKMKKNERTWSWCNLMKAPDIIKLN
jgi:hypothetical protein